MLLPDYYRILGLQPGASDKEIKTAYRKLSKKFHPDLNNGDKAFEAKFRAVQEAYEVLSSPSAKAAYLQQFADRHTYNPDHAATGNSTQTGYERNTHQPAPDAAYKKEQNEERGSGIGNIIYFGILIFNLIVVFRSCSEPDADHVTYVRNIPENIQSTATGAAESGPFRSLQEDGVVDNAVDMASYGYISAPNDYTDSMQMIKIKKAGKRMIYADTASQEDIEFWILGKFNRYCKGKTIKPNTPEAEDNVIYKRGKAYSFYFKGEEFRIKYTDQKDTSRIINIPVYDISIVLLLHKQMMFGTWHIPATETNVSTNITVALRHVDMYFDCNAEPDLYKRINKAFKQLRKFYKKPANYPY